MIKIKNLFKKYSIGKEKNTILKDVSLEINQGKFICILGTSGCGKSTLLNIIGGLDHEIEGEMYVDDRDTSSFSEKDWARYRKKSIGFVFQNFNLIPHLNARENIELAMKFNGCGKEERQQRAEELLKKVGLSERSSYLPSQLSGGQKQRVAIARALANQPKVILADEPTGALDSVAAKEIMSILHQVNESENVTVILVTHNKTLAGQADWVIHMADGRIQDIRKQEVKEKREIEKDGCGPDRTGKMSLGSAVQSGVKNLLLKKKRSILTVLGTAIGITGMVLMLGIGNGADEKIHHELRAFVGDDTMWISGQKEGSILGAEDRKKLEGITGVETVLDSSLFMSTFYYDGKSVKGHIDVLGPEKIATDYEKSLADQGSIPKSDSSREIVLTCEAAQQLAGKNDVKELIGKDITVLARLIRNGSMTYETEQKFTVTGIIDTGIIAGASFIPYETAKEMAVSSVRNKNIVQEGLEVRASSDASYEEILEEIRALGYKVETNKEDFESINILLMVLKVFLIFIAAIALLVSGIMIKIVLHTNVVERTKEIGIMCAIGAGKKDIKRIFVAEAGLLGVFSGITGIAAGQICGMALNGVIHHRFEAMNFSLYQMNLKTVLLCLAVSVLIAACAGMKPAKKAARTAPAEALRYE